MKHYLISLSLFSFAISPAWSQGAFVPVGSTRAAQVMPAQRPARPVVVSGNPGVIRGMQPQPAQAVSSRPPSILTYASAIGLGDPVSSVLHLHLPLEAIIEAQPRMQRLKELTFDRKPGAILQAWMPHPHKQANPDRLRMQQPKPPTDEKLEKELESFQKAVALGDWLAVKKYLQSLTPGEAKVAFARMLESLSEQQYSPQMMMQMRQQGMQAMPHVMERNAFFTSDLVGLAACAPLALEKEHLQALARMLQQALENGVVIEHVVQSLKAESAKPAGLAAVSKRQAALLLAYAEQPYHVGAFLPDSAKALTEKDLEALNLLARHYLEMHSREKKSPFLEKAWDATLHIIALEGPGEEKDEALRRAVELAPRVREELGQAWLDESYSKHPERGMDILATLGTMVSQAMQTNPHNQDARLKGLQLQKTAIEALLKAAPQQADTWRNTLTLLAANWLKEADYSRQYDLSTGFGARMRRDYYGNYYFANPNEDMQRQQMMMQQRGMVQALTTPEVLRCAPSDDWLQRIDSGLRPKIAIVLAQLHLKVADEDSAFPHIAALAPTHPDQAKELIKEFLRVWTRNHDPNAEKNMYRSSWIYFYGFEARSESIPLTRSKQERNLVELSSWVKRLRGLNLGDIDEEMLARAFTTCHSSAEVYKTEAIETVFGPMGGLQPKTLASLAQTMRGNLAGLWRLPSEQERQKTKRKQKDIESEVRRGYAVALLTVENGLEKFPTDPGLLCAKAALLHDQVTYEQDLAKSSDFSARRAEALSHFQQAAQRYHVLVASRTLSEDEESTQVYDLWFYASLGAVDLAAITEDRLPDFQQARLIRQAIIALPGEASKRHMDKFANNLFTRMSSAKPQIKFRYLKAGFEIVDPDHIQATEARKVFDYYQDLVTEIKLETQVDGSTTVGHGQPFGLFVNLRHTRDIERESGGFGRYLVNQNSLMFSYNYGRPTADYRDRFESVAKEALKEHFEVVSVTFQNQNVHSRAHREYGWRITPYAYILLKPRGPQVDKVPPLRLDLDFLDTSGYVVLPIESAGLPLDCKPAAPEPRPVRNLQITQTLDERQASKGKLHLEIKATGIGLVGSLDELLNLDFPEFDLKKVEDNGVNVAKFDEDGESIAVVSERNWVLTLQAKEGLQAMPTSFKFGTAKPTEAELQFQRYNDADVLAVKQQIALNHQYGKQSRNWLPWVLVGSAGLLFIAVLAYIFFRRRPAPTATVLPDNLTPFTVLEFLSRVRSDHGLSEQQRADLHRSIADIEHHYFANETNGKSMDLRPIAEKWMFATTTNQPRN